MMTKQINLRLDEDLIKNYEDLAKQKNLDRSSLVRKVLIEGIKRERLKFAIQKYILKEISIERAAEIAKISIHELMLKLEELNVPSNITMEYLKKIE
jgi:predicted HTH domain antitoxin